MDYIYIYTFNLSHPCSQFSGSQLPKSPPFHSPATSGMVHDLQEGVQQGTCEDLNRSISIHGKTMGKPWENQGKTMGKPWENHRKTIGKPWENHRKTMGKPWENHGKTMGKPWENHMSMDWFCWENLKETMVKIPSIVLGLPVQKLSHHAILWKWSLRSIWSRVFGLKYGLKSGEWSVAEHIEAPIVCQEPGSAAPDLIEIGAK